MLKTQINVFVVEIAPLLQRLFGRHHCHFRPCGYKNDYVQYLTTMRFIMRKKREFLDNNFGRSLFTLPSESCYCQLIVFMTWFIDIAVQQKITSFRGTSPVNESIVDEISQGSSKHFWVPGEM